ncbi:MAG: hypothetical protein OEV44_14895, partial [Spirochaetota bacterium]|nr:hypothetical protein [Spirochaetota bacterium]
MRKFGILFFILLIFILNCEDTKDEKRSTKSGEHPLIELVKINAKTLIQNVDLSKEVSDNEILDLLWGGNGIVKTVKTKDKKTIETFSHPVNFTNLIDLYYINKNGLYYYNYKKNKLKILKNGDLIKKL